METIQAQITLDNAKAIQELQRLNQTITNSFQSLSKTLGDSLGKVDSKKAGQKIANDISSEGKKAGVSFGDLFKSSLLANLASSGIQTAISKIFDFGKSFFTASSQMQDFRADFTTFLGDAEKGGKMLEKIFNVGAATPFQTKEIATATTSLLSFGVAEEKVIGTGIRLGDAAQGNAEKLKTLTREYGQAHGAGILLASSARLMAETGFNPLSIIAKKTGETMGEVKKRAEDSKVSFNELEEALVTATDKGGQFYNLMANKSATASGRLSTLADQFTAVGMSILGVNKEGEVLTGGIFDGISNGIGLVAGALAMINWESVGQGAVGAFQFLLTNIGTMVNSAMLAFSPLLGTFDTFGQTLTLIGQGSLQVLVSGFTGLMGAVYALNTIIAPLLTMFLDLANMVLPTLFNWLSVIAGPVAIATAAFFAFQTAGWIMAQVGGMISAVVTGIQSAFMFLISPIGLAVLAIGLLALAWQTNFMGIQEMTVGAIQGIGGFLTGGFQSFLAGTASFLKGFVKFFNDAFVFTNMLVAGFITGCLQGMAALNTGMITALTLILETVVGGFQYMVKGAFDILAGFVTGVAEYAMNVGDVFAGMIDFASGLLTGDWSRMVNGAGKVFGGLVGMVLSPAKAVVGIIESAINNVIDMINGVTQNSVVQAVLKEFGADVGVINKVQFSDSFANWANNAQAGAEGLVAGADAAAKATERLAQRQSTLNSIKSSISGIGEGISKAVDVSGFTNGLRQGSSDIEKAVSDYSKDVMGRAGKDVFNLDEDNKGIDEMTTKLQNMAKSAGESMKNFKLSDVMKNPLGEFQKQMDTAQKKSAEDSKRLMDEEKAKVFGGSPQSATGQPTKAGGGGGGGKSEAEKQADEAQKLAEQKAKDEANAQKEIEKLKVENIKNDQDRQKASLDLQAKNDLENFKGNENQKAEFAKLQAENVAKEKAEIDQKLAEQNQKEAEKTQKLAEKEVEKTQKEQIQQQKEVAKTGEEYDNLIGKLSVLNQKQAEYTNKTKESTKMADSQKITDIREQLAKLGTASFGQMGIITGDTAPTPTTPINQGQVILSNENPQAQNQPTQPQPQPQADPATLTEPIEDSAKKTTEVIDTLIEKIKTGISGAISEGAKAITEEITKMDEGVVVIFNLVNENWITIAQAIGQNVINGIILGLSQGERSIYSAIASLETNALKAVNIEIQSREEFGEKEGRGAAMGIGSVMNPNVELIRGFKPFSAGDFQKNNQDNSKNVNINSVSVNNNQDFDVFKGQLNGIFVG